jgi:hypothetical protein
MAVTTNILGPNSRQIVVTGELGPQNIISAVEAVLVELGWTLYDTDSSGPKQTFVTKVYSAPNADDPVSPTTKYMIIRWDCTKGRWFLSCCEAWNTTTHVATNESFQYHRNFALALQNSNLTIYIFASPRYAVFQTAIRDELGIWQGVFEFERGEMPEDTAANQALGLSGTCFGYTNGRVFANIWANSITTTVTGIPKSFTMFAIPRTINGFTGVGAARQFTLQTPYGNFPPSHNELANNTSLSLNDSSWSNYGITRIFNSYAYSNNNTSIKLVVTPKLSAYTNQYIAAGRIYGINIANNVGEQLDTIDIRTDANGFFSTTGTSNTHYIFGLTGSTAYSEQGGFQTYSRPLNSSSFAAQTIAEGLVVNGRYIWCTQTAAANSIPYYDLDSDSWTSFTVTGLGTPVSGGIAYDGSRFIYVTGTLGFARINVADFTVNTTSAITGSSGYRVVEVDENYIYVAHNTSNTTPRMDIFNQNTTDTSDNLPTYANNWTSATIPQSCFINGIRSLVDNEQANGVYLSITLTTGTLSAGTSRIVKVRSNTNNYSTNTTNGWISGLPSTGSGRQSGRSFWWYDGRVVVFKPINVAASTGNYGGSFLPSTGARIEDSPTNYEPNFFGGTSGLAHQSSEPIPWCGYRIAQAATRTSGLTQGSFPCFVPINSSGTLETSGITNSWTTLGNARLFTQNGIASYSGTLITDYVRVYRIQTTGVAAGTTTSATGGFIYGNQMSTRNYNGFNMAHVLIKA